MQRRTLQFAGPAGSHPDPAAWSIVPAKTYSTPATYDGITLDGQGNLALTAKATKTGLYPNLRINSLFTVTAPFAVEFTAQVPTVMGAWPGLFLVEAAPPAGVTPGEIDVLECLGRELDVVKSNIISRDAQGGKVDSGWNNAQTTIPGLCKAFHSFKVVVDTDFINFYIDNRITYAYTAEQLAALGVPWAFAAPMRVCMTLVAGEQGGTPSPADYPQSMLVRSVTTTEF